MGCGYGDFDEACSNCGSTRCDGCKGIMETLEWALVHLKRVSDAGLSLEGFKREDLNMAIQVWRNNHWKRPEFWRA